MKIWFFFIILIFVTSCTQYKKNTYWCGDHPCINKKEKEDYFKKTMIVEIRNIGKENKRNNKKIEEIMEQAQVEQKKKISTEKTRLKQAKLEEKRRLKEEKELEKQVLLEEKRRLKEEKELEKQVLLEEKRRLEKKKDLKKKIKKDEKKLVSMPKAEKKEKIELSSKNSSSDLFDKILKRNLLRPYPNLNNMPE